jgi:hypothetical protein
MALKTHGVMLLSRNHQKKVRMCSPSYHFEYFHRLNF